MFKKLLATSIALSLATTASAGDKGDINLAYVEWSSEIASTNVVRVVLEEAGYDVELTALSAAIMYQAVADKQADALVAAWLPTTHKEYLARFEEDIDDLGSNLEGTKLGLVVPTYTYEAGIKSIEDLDANADKFDSEIVGIDPGAGLMNLTEKVIEEYGIENVQLKSSTGAIMTASLADAIKNNENIVVTGWTPHWMFARYDLKYLEDPKEVYGGAEEIHTIVRKGLKEDMPEAYQILDNFHWTPENMNELMLMNQEEGADPYENAKKWVAEHPEIVAEWVK